MMNCLRDVGVNVMMLMVDSIIGGNCECDKCIGFLILFWLIFVGLIEFVLKLVWVINYLIYEWFCLL